MVAKRRANSEKDIRETKKHATGRRDEGVRKKLLRLSDECLLLVLSFLNAADLVRVEQVCSRLAHLVREGSTWRRCFVEEFVTNESNPNTIPIGSIAPLFSRSKQDAALSQLPVRYHKSKLGAAAQPDWRRLYGVWHNWHRGSMRVAALGLKQNDPAAHNLDETGARAFAGEQQLDAETFVQASVNLVITARKSHHIPETCDDLPDLVRAFPLISVYLADAPTASDRHLPFAELLLEEVAQRVSVQCKNDAFLKSYITEHGLALTAMRLDSGMEAWSVRFCLCLQPGIIVILSVAINSTLSFHVDHILFDLSSARTRPIEQVGFCHDLLVTCTDTFRMNLWNMQRNPVIIRTLTSSSSRWPACLTARKVRHSHYEVTMCYTTPLRTNAWTITLQQLQVQLTEPSAIITSQIAHAATPSLCSGKVTTVMYDDPFVVIGTDTNVLDVYRVESTAQEAAGKVGRAASASPAGPGMRVRYCRTLHGHTSGVQSIALHNGRCVSGSSDGSVRIWSMYPAPGEHIATLHGHVPKSRHRESLLPLRKTMSLGDTKQTLSMLVRKLAISPDAHGVIKHVSMTFDKILCVTTACRSEAPNYEQVQIWHFAM
ncbi:hypothetical protein MPSI1_001305 [Malassezia psittaci]|uniref:F-box domain-containing protein n=1 Tax=Malassezia psittaci TaxID=1821823 RepID=A0AAF0JD68_9BASI|nr:hypothetical protein MPSI1_001305 [Malassezia psittaci]